MGLVSWYCYRLFISSVPLLPNRADFRRPSGKEFDLIIIASFSTKVKRCLSIAIRIPLPAPVSRRALYNCAAYIFAALFKGKKVGLISILVLQVFPSFMGMVALSRFIKPLTSWETLVLIIYVAASVQLWLIKGYFNTARPR